MDRCELASLPLGDKTFDVAAIQPIMYDHDFRSIVKDLGYGIVGETLYERSIAQECLLEIRSETLFQLDSYFETELENGT